jgi:hypothetical protein
MLFEQLRLRGIDVAARGQHHHPPPARACVTHDRESEGSYGKFGTGKQLKSTSPLDSADEGWRGGVLDDVEGK